MFKTRLFKKEKKKDYDSNWMLESNHASEDLKAKRDSSYSSDGDGASSAAEDSDEDSVDLMSEKKIYSNEHKHHADTDEDFRWSIKPDCRLSNGANAMAVKKPSAPKLMMTTMAGTIPEEDSNDDGAYLTSDDEDLYMEEPVPKSSNVQPVATENVLPKKEVVDPITEEVAPRKKKKKKKIFSKSYRSSSVSTASSKKAKKKKKKVERASGVSATSIRSTGSKKAKKKQKNKGELKVSKPKKKKGSIKDRIRASLAIVGERHGLKKQTLDEQVIAAIDADEHSETNDQNDPIIARSTSDPSPSPVLDKEIATEFSKPNQVRDQLPNVTMTSAREGDAASKDVASSLERFKAAGKKMRTIQKLRTSVIDHQFAEVFNSHARDSMNAGLMSESDRATIDKLLAELQQYEEQLEQERNQLAEDREMMVLQQESVEHMLEEENEKTQQLEARVLELENILDTQVHQQDNEELMLKVQMLEDEIERQEEALAKMATEHQEVLKRQTSAATERTASMRSFNGSSSNLLSENDEQEYSDTSPFPNVAKLQGEILQLRSSLTDKDNAIEEQATEIARLKEQLLEKTKYGPKPDKLSQSDEVNQFQSEIQQLKQQLTEVESARQAEVIKVERLKASEAKKTQALKQAEEEKDEAVRKLDTHLLLSINTTKPRESTISNVLDIGAPAQYGTPLGSAIAEVSEDEDIEASDELVQEKKNWFGFGGEDDKKAKEGEHEKKHWFGFGGSDNEDDGKEEEDSGWFGFGKKEKNEELLAA